MSGPSYHDDRKTPFEVTSSGDYSRVGLFVVDQLGELQVDSVVGLMGHGIRRSF